MTNTKTLSLAAAGVLFAAAAGSASAQYAYGNNGYYGNTYGQRTVRCESNDGRTRICGADTRGGVQLVDQTSQSACVRGRTWGADERGIWVTRGCRGIFAVNSGAYGSAYGNNNGYNNSYNNGYNNNSGYSNNSYNNGYYSNGYGNNNRRVVRCESRDGRTRSCSIDTRYGVTLVNQHSSSPCIEGSTWGVNRNSVWVTRGCRGDFALGNTGYGYNNGYYDRRY